jgi:hypothetical protein
VRPSTPGLARERVRHGQQVLHPVFEFVDENVFPVLSLPPLGGIDDRQQQHAVAVVGVLEALCADQHRATADMRKRRSDLVVEDRRALRDHLLKEKPQLVYVPLSIAQPRERHPDRLVPIGLERRVEGRVGADDGQVGGKHQQRVADRVQNPLGLHMRAAQETIQFIEVQ